MLDMGFMPDVEFVINHPTMTPKVSLYNLPSGLYSYDQIVMYNNYRLSVIFRC